MNKSNITRTYIGSVDNLEQIDLIEIQKKSWQHFLDNELVNILHEFFPIEDYTKKSFILELLDVSFGDPRFSEEECIDKKLTYQFPVYIKVKLTNKKREKEK